MVPYGYINKKKTYDASPKYYHLRAFSESLKQLPSLGGSEMYT